MSSHIIITNMLDNFTTAPENYCVHHLRSSIHAILMMDSRYAIIVVRLSRVIMPYHRLVAAFPRRIPASSGTMRAGMRY